MTNARPTAPALVLAALAALACSGGGASSNTGAQDVSVSVTPASAWVAPLGQQPFAAQVSGTANTAVSWTVTEGAAGGSVSSSGAYTAPAGTGTYHVVATSAADPTKSATAQVTVSNAPADLCSGLVTDKLAHPMTAVAKPAVGQTYVDPQFGTTIRRVSDAAATGAGDVIPVYSTIQAWNADESYMVLYHVGSGGHHLYNGKTYAHIKALNISPADIEQVYWDTTDPKILYYANGRKFYRYNVDTDAATTLHDFSTAPASCTSNVTGGTDPMWSSWDSSHWGFSCGSRNFSYDRLTDTVGSVLTLSTGGNAPEASPSGASYYINVADTQGQSRDVNMTLVQTLTGWESAEHASLGMSDGKDTLFGVQFDSTPNGTIVAADMATGARRAIVGPSTGYPYPPSGTHLSAVAYKAPGWLTSSIIGNTNGAGLLDQEVLLVNANTGGSVCRIAHHRSTGGSYWAEPHATISPSGTRVLFGSDWGGGAVVDSYVVELPSYTP